MKFFYFLVFSAAMMGCSWAVDNMKLWWACGLFIICMAVGVWAVLSFVFHKASKKLSDGAGARPMGEDV